MAKRNVPIINGRRMQHVPDMGVHGRDIVRSINPDSGRRVVLERGIKVETVNPKKHYSKRELLDRKGRGVKITEIPERTKGYSPTFAGRRSDLSKRIISEQVYDIAGSLYTDGVDFDTDNADWLVIPRFRLPPIWKHVARTAPLLVVFPDGIPSTATRGLLLAGLRPRFAQRASVSRRVPRRR